MKKNKNKKIIFTCITISFICVIICLGSFFFDIKIFNNPSNRNREWWAALGSVLCGIGTFYTAFVAYMIAKEQEKQTIEQNKIALYEKRYKVYILFQKYYNLSKYNFNNIYSINTRYLSILKNNLSNLNNQLNKTIQPSYSLNTENTDTIQNNIIVNEQMIYNELKKNEETREQILNEILLTKFCFQKHISKPIINFFECLFDKNDYDSLYEEEEELGDLLQQKEAYEETGTYTLIGMDQKYKECCENIKRIQIKLEEREKKIIDARNLITSKIINEMEDLLTVY